MNEREIISKINKWIPSCAEENSQNLISSDSDPIPSYPHLVVVLSNW